MIIKLNFEAKSVPESRNLDFNHLERPEWKILTKEFGSTYLCNRQSHRWLGRGEAVMGGYSDVVMNESHLSTACTAAASDDGVHFLEGGMEREAHHQ